MTKYEKLIKIGVRNGLYAGLADYEAMNIDYIAVIYDNDNIHIRGLLQSIFNYSEVISLDTFSSNQRLKVVLTFINYLLPYINKGRFICSDSRIFTTSFMHQGFKGKILFPNIFLLETDAIVSDREDFKASRILNTKKVFAEFLVEYIMKDEQLKQELDKKDSVISEIVQDIQALNFDGTKMKNYITSNNRHCKIHNVYFSDKDCICYACKQNGIPESRAIFKNKEYFDKLLKNSPKFDGGEANLYDFMNTTKVQKIFKPCVNLELKSKIIGKVLQRDELFKKFNKENPFIQFVTIENVLYEENRGSIELKGYTEEQIDGAYKISCLKDKNFVSENSIGQKHVIEILLKICKGIEFLHSVGGFIGDLNGGNILIKGDVVYFIDFDGMSFDEVKNCVFTNLYIYPPSAEKNNITKVDDWYSLAVQAFYYLTYSHPFKGISSQKGVPQDEMERMKYGKSVLGNHGIKPPSINIGWDFMPEYLVKFFLQTFEGKKRESMYEVLQKYYESMYKGTLNFSKIQTKNPVRFCIDEDIYVDVDSVVRYKEDSGMYMGNGIISKFVKPESCIICGETGLCLIDKTRNKVIHSSRVLSNIVDFCENNVYYLINGDTTLMVDKLPDNGEQVSTHIVRNFSNQNKILSVAVLDNKKFVIVVENEDTNSFEIYCNTMLFYTCSSFEYINVGIEYDKVSNKWIVVFNKNEGADIIIIKDDQTYERQQLNNVVSRNWCFYGNVLYYTKQGKICHYNVNTKKHTSTLCDVADENSSVLRNANKFVVVKQKECYVYTKT